MDDIKKWNNLYTFPEFQRPWSVPKFFGSWFVQFRGVSITIREFSGNVWSPNESTRLMIEICDVAKNGIKSWEQKSLMHLHFQMKPTRRRAAYHKCMPRERNWDSSTFHYDILFIWAFPQLAMFWCTVVTEKKHSVTRWVGLWCLTTCHTLSPL